MLKRLVDSAAVLTVALGVAVLTGDAQAASIGINFRGDNNVDLDASETAGATGYTQINWNNFDKYGGDNGFPNTTDFGSTVKDNSGVTVTGVRADFDAAGKYNSGSSTATPNGKLMNGYQDSNGNANTPGTSLNDTQNRPYVGIFNLGTDYTAGGYSVIVYTDGDTTGRGGAFWIEEANYTTTARTQTGAALTSKYYAQDPGNFNTTGFVQVTSTTSGSPTSGNYIVFTGLTNPNIVIRADEGTEALYNVGGNRRTPINGVQIVATAVPEPASLGVLGLAGVAMLARRRRTV